ncbi:hypothetical protein IFM89_024476 [Coptis chinensis]|uniref:Uncharacterized protein n=1 Tax=Coptis chinensis TaxID=261450 RepID=A0A835H7V1_9MAGN|nr:hypothetical protein IFM89_024476 [Coptis chinensis]
MVTMLLIEVRKRKLILIRQRRVLKIWRVMLLFLV